MPTLTNPSLQTQRTNHLSWHRGPELHPRERHGVYSSERENGDKDTENEGPLKVTRKGVEVVGTHQPCRGLTVLLTCDILVLPLTLLRIWSFLASDIHVEANRLNKHGVYLLYIEWRTGSVFKPGPLRMMVRPPQGETAFQWPLSVFLCLMVARWMLQPRTSCLRSKQKEGR
ncbi:unnamed protein product [Nyctereutes procyonoides]|uniref:(raccoon dog) hypothetical protein n=1 Tax=Nyctereutes procyonoides TaxID=34880 RepID=A0A811YRL8_NYCPR|nr:unnamed protein product [Nyctereutes procyonoides]